MPLTCTIIEIPDTITLSTPDAPAIEDEVRVDLITPDREFFGIFGRVPDREDRKILKDVVEVAKLLKMPPSCPGVL